MLYAVIAQDIPNGVEHRLAIRPVHLEYLASLGDKLLFAGPFLDEAGKPKGSMVVLEAASLEEAKAMVVADPYVINGVFASYTVDRWNWGVNNPTGRGL